MQMQMQEAPPFRSRAKPYVPALYQESATCPPLIRRVRRRAARLREIIDQSEGEGYACMADKLFYPLSFSFDAFGLDSAFLESRRPLIGRCSRKGWVGGDILQKEEP